jgi:hypothetical protein
LKLCGETPLWKIIYGDAVSHVGVLNTLYPFHVEVALVAPNAVAKADVVHRVSSRYTVSYENGWFLSSFEVALAFFGTVVSGVIPEMDVEMPREDEPTATATHNVTAAPLGDESGVTTTTDVATEVPTAEGHNQAVDAEIWEHVTPSTGYVADKATVIRSAITAKLGKQRASELLAKTKMGVARDGQGKNIRILKVGGVTLKLK